MAQGFRVEEGNQRPTECCCGCSIKTGCLIIGWLGVVGGLLGCALYIAVLVLSQYVDRSDRFGNSFSQYETKSNTFYMILFAIGIPCSIIHVTVSSILLYGISKGLPKLLKIWIVYGYVNLGLSVLTLNCIGFALVWYFIKIVSAHRDNLLEGTNTGVGTVGNPGYGIPSYDNKVVHNSRF